MKSVIKNYISVQISSFCVLFLEGWAVFNIFAPAGPQGVPKRIKICGLIKICHNRILHAKFCIHVKFQLLVIILLEMANFDPLLTPGGLENDVRMGNRSGYQAILKNNPQVYQKPLSTPGVPGMLEEYLCTHQARLEVLSLKELSVLQNNYR